VTGSVDVAIEIEGRDHYGVAGSGHMSAKKKWSMHPTVLDCVCDALRNKRIGLLRQGARARLVGRRRWEDFRLRGKVGHTQFE